MADKTVTVKSSGGDYTSLNAALAGESTNLVSTLDGILTIECYAMSDTTAASTGTGYTTDADHYINITVPTGNRHAGKWDDTKYKLTISTEASTLVINAAYTRVKYLQIKDTSGAYDSRYATYLFTNSAGSTIANCIITCANTGRSDRRGITSRAAGNFYVYNNIIYDFSASGYRGIMADLSANKMYAYHNTVVNCATGIDCGGYQDIVAIGNLTNDCTDGFANDFDSTSNYNVSDIASDPPGANSVVGEVAFVDEANKDFHLASSDTVAIDAGNGGTPKSVFTDDIDGESRPVTDGDWDIGADEYVAPAGGGVPLSNPFSRPFRQAFGRGGL